MTSHGWEGMQKERSQLVQATRKENLIQLKIFLKSGKRRKKIWGKKSEKSEGKKSGKNPDLTFSKKLLKNRETWFFEFYQWNTNDFGIKQEWKL